MSSVSYVNSALFIQSVFPASEEQFVLAYAKRISMEIVIGGIPVSV